MRLIKIRKVNNTRRKFAPRSKLWKLHEGSVKNDLSSCINEYRKSSQKGAFVEGYWSILKGVMLEATFRGCGWTEGPARHGEIWWWNDVSISISVSKKFKPLKEWKQGGNTGR